MSKVENGSELGESVGSKGALENPYVHLIPLEGYPSDSGLYTYRGPIPRPTEADITRIQAEGIMLLHQAKSRKAAEER